MNDTVKILFGLFGGLAIFIFGMNMMSECLQKAAGEKMKKILSLLTKNPVGITLDDFEMDDFEGELSVYENPPFCPDTTVIEEVSQIIEFLK